VVCDQLCKLLIMTVLDAPGLSELARLGSNSGLATKVAWQIVAPQRVPRRGGGCGRVENLGAGGLK